MRFTKTFALVDKQIEILESRGMVFENKKEAEYYLSNISYYRLSAYWYTFLKHPKTEHIFNSDTTFNKALKTYVFDRKLRVILFDEIERIEIALRTQLNYQYCTRHGNNWYENKDLYRDTKYYYKFNSLLSDELDKTREVFIQHYKRKYTDPPHPPAWMALELASFGQLSTLYKNLKNDDARKKVADHFAIHENVLSSWLECLSYIRNACAHHMRLWNRKLSKTPTLPSITQNSWITMIDNERANRLYYAICVIRYLINHISPQNSFSKKIAKLFSTFPNIPKYYMGFPNGWENEELWKD